MGDSTPPSAEQAVRPGGWGFDSPRLAPLWRLAYALVRLDQLPSGGWGKGLFPWMAALWKSDSGTIDMSGDTRKKGGTDLTTCTLYRYYLFLSRILPQIDITLLLTNENQTATADRVYLDFEERMGAQGSVGLRRAKGGEDPEVQVRHTLMGCITFLLCERARGLGSSQKQLKKACGYLLANLARWEQDQSHLYAMTAAAVKLHEMLGQPAAAGPLKLKKMVKVRRELVAHLPSMMAAALAPVSYKPRPPVDAAGSTLTSIFRPYKGFWRMERSNFLMYFPFLVRADGAAFLPTVTTGFRAQCARVFVELLRDIELPYDGDAPYRHLVHYHRSLDGEEPPRDWGLSAELAALLQMKAVRELLTGKGMSAEEYDQKRDALNHALVDTFDAYSRHDSRFGPSDLFEFTFGFSFGHVLHLFDRQQIGPAELISLDRAIDELCARGVTEKGLAALIRERIDPAPVSSVVDQRAVRDLMIAKLESGEHTPDKALCTPPRWAEHVSDAVDGTTLFYNGHGGEKHADRYAADPQRGLIRQIEDIFEKRPPGRRTALDVGCGAGQYAELLVDLGFEVTLLDASPRMLELARRRPGLESRLKRDAVKLVNIFDVAWDGLDEPFDLIFASAIMIHVPEDRRARVYAHFHRLLKPDGVLYVSYKIGDHTLISEDERYFAYYRHEGAAKHELEAHHFGVQQMTINFNTRDMYHYPKLIQWANFYCYKR